MSNHAIYFSSSIYIYTIFTKSVNVIVNFCKDYLGARRICYIEKSRLNNLNDQMDRQLRPNCTIYRFTTTIELTRTMLRTNSTSIIGPMDYWQHIIIMFRPYPLSASQIRILISVRCIDYPHLIISHRPATHKSFPLNCRRL